MHSHVLFEGLYFENAGQLEGDTPHVHVGLYVPSLHTHLYPVEELQ